VTVVAVLVFARAASYPFVGDDRDIIAENTAVTAPSPWFESASVPYWNIPHGEDMALWRPLTTGVFSVAWASGGGSPALFHGINLALHALNAVLVLALVGGVAGRVAGLCAGLLFAVHPIHTEAVVNVVGMAELLSAAAFLGAWLLFWRSEGRPRLRLILGIGALYAVAMLSKESGATLPAALLLLHQFRADTTRTTWREELRSHSGLLLVLVCVLVGVLGMRARVLGGLHAPLPPVGADLLATIPRIWTAAAIWVEYVRLLVLPSGLALDYSPGRIPVRLMWDATAALGAGLALAGLGLALWGWRRGVRARLFAMGMVWFVLTVLPTSNLPVLSGVLLAERTLYLPSLGFVLVVTALFGLAPTPWGGRRTALWAVMLVALGLQSWHRTELWESDGRYWSEVAARAPTNGRGHQHTARRLWVEGDRSAALRSYSKAFGWLSGDHIIAAEVAERLFEARHYRAAEAVARLAWDKAPSYASGPALLALALLGQGRDREALEAAQAAVAAEPEGAQALDLLRGIERAVEGRAGGPSGARGPGNP